MCDAQNIVFIVPRTRESKNINSNELLAKPPAYIAELIKLSVYATENNREKMAECIENALDSGADVNEIRKAVFRAEKKLNGEVHAASEYRINKVLSSFNEQTTAEKSYGIATALYLMSRNAREKLD